MSKHTPGPWSDGEWSVTGPTAAAANVAERSLSGEFHVPNVRVCQHKDTGKQVVALLFGRSQEEADSNARLISAAPELLEALKAVAHEPGFEQDEPYGRLVLAAIAKATGEA